MFFSSEQIWRNVAMGPLQWMGAVRMRVQTADKSITIMSCVFVRNQSLFFLQWRIKLILDGLRIFSQFYILFKHLYIWINASAKWGNVNINFCILCAIPWKVHFTCCMSTCLKQHIMKSQTPKNPKLTSAWKPMFLPLVSCRKLKYPLVKLKNLHFHKWWPISCVLFELFVHSSEAMQWPKSLQFNVDE